MKYIAFPHAIFLPKLFSRNVLKSLDLTLLQGSSGGLDGKKSGYAPGSIPESGRSFAEGNGNPLQYSCLRNPMDRRAWWATVYEVTTESEITERLILFLAYKKCKMWNNKLNDTRTK